LKRGETLLLYTDGVTDAIGANRERYGPERLQGRLHAASPSPAELITDIVSALNDFQVGDQADDTAMLALHRAASCTQPALGAAETRTETTMA
jgi:sigma-B regulation protein RsbU (phosphoserine phosphatase)